jgi:hypothetical protein
MRCVLSLALTPALSLGERDNSLPPPSSTCDWIGRTIVKTFSATKACSLSSGERARVRANVKPHLAVLLACGPQTLTQPRTRPHP